jgi:tryptophanyl-tRNA synthetase
MSLQDPQQKMSKSSPNERSRILITAEPKEIMQRIMGAVTDSQNTVTYEPESRHGVANLLELIAQCSAEPTTPAEVADSLVDAKLVDLKIRCTEAVTAELSGIRERYTEFLERHDGKYLDDIEAAGAEVARRNAEETMKLVRSAMGLATLR